MIRFLSVSYIIFACITCFAESKSFVLQLQLRSRVQPFKGVEEWREVQFVQEVKPHETAIVVCDMWDDHWCKKAAQRCGEIAKKMNPVLQAARKKGILIIHAPSECMSFYKDSPARKRMEQVKKVPLPKALALNDPPLPVDSSDRGCDDDPPNRNERRVWNRQQEVLQIDEAQDGISDNGHEIYSLCQEKGIKNLLIMGVHTNMCVLHRSFAIKPMTRLGMKCYLVRDLTDSMYNPKMKPMVTHEEGTERIIQYIEQYWCPSLLSEELTK